MVETKNEHTDIL